MRLSGAQFQNRNRILTKRKYTGKVPDMENIFGFARQLRQRLTPQERRLWYQLRDRRFSRFKFRRQHPVGPYILDLHAVRHILPSSWMGDSMMKEAVMMHGERRGLSDKDGEC